MILALGPSFGCKNVKDVSRCTVIVHGSYYSVSRYSVLFYGKSQRALGGSFSLRAESASGGESRKLWKSRLALTRL